MFKGAAIKYSQHTYLPLAKFLINCYVYLIDSICQGV